MHDTLTSSRPYFCTRPAPKNTRCLCSWQRKTRVCVNKRWFSFVLEDMLGSPSDKGSFCPAASEMCLRRFSELKKGGPSNQSLHLPMKKCLQDHFVSPRLPRTNWRVSLSLAASPWAKRFGSTNFRRLPRSLGVRSNVGAE